MAEPKAVLAAEKSEQTRWFAEGNPATRICFAGVFAQEVPSLADVDDIVQETYARLFRTSQAGGVAEVRPYLFVIARNAAFDFFRRNKVAAVDNGVEIDALSVAEDRPDAAEIVNRDQELEVLTDAIRTLPERCRQVFTLRKLHGLSHRAIAEQLGISINTVESQLYLGIFRCRGYLASRGISREQLKQAKSVASRTKHGAKSPIEALKSSFENNVRP